jgi:biopolymer transport protein TolR
MKTENKRMLSEINVTPFVDVMLVLLVIFMITAPLIQHGIKVDLPRAATEQIETKEDELIITIDKHKKIYILDNKYSMNEFQDKIKAIYKTKQRKKIFLNADRILPYEIVIKVMAEIKNAGFDEVGLVTEPILNK